MRSRPGAGALWQVRHPQGGVHLVLLAAFLFLSANP
jgi:hypothetical protein